MQSEQLFEILIREHSSMLITYLRSLVQQQNVVDDLFQETMLTAWKRIDDFDRTRPFGPWLRGIAKKHALAHYRSAQRDSELVNQVSIEHIEKHFMHIEQQAGDSFKEKVAALHSCIENLPDIYQQAIQQRYIEERKPREIRQHTNLSAEALKKRLLRAKTRLLTCLKLKGTLFIEECSETHGGHQ